MKKSIDTLVDDIYDIFLNPSHKISESNLKELGENLKACVKKKIEEASVKRKPTLRMSILGKPNRQLWFELNQPEDVVEFGEVDVFEPNPSKYLKFLFGDIIEQLLVFLVKEAGHTLEFAQDSLVIDGIEGHTDGVLDRVTVDFKTASNYQFNTKFRNRGLVSGNPELDPFGYRGQLASYRDALVKKYPHYGIDKENVAWIVFNKESGEILLLKADNFDLEFFNSEERVKEVKELLAKPNPPEEKCYQEIPVGKSGNMSLHKNCTYCAFKDKCWTGVRKFKYSDGVKHLTKVVEMPRVEEVI